MAASTPAHRGGRRNGEEHGAQIAATYNQRLDSFESSLLQVIRDREGHTGPTSTTNATIMLICSVLKIVRQKLTSGMEGQGVGPRYPVAHALIVVALGCVTCGLLMYILLGNMPWPIYVPCVLMLIFAFIAN